MAKYQNQIEYSITTKLDSKGLTQLQSQIKEVEASLKRLSGNDLNDKLKFNEPIRQLQELNKALSSSFNSSLGMLDLSKFKAQIQSAGVTAKDLGIAFKNSGAQGQVAMNNLLGQIGKIDTGLKRSSTTVDKMFNTISNTVRWGIVSSGFSAMLNSLHQSVDYVKELDDSLTQIMLVTDYSRQQMNEYAKSANEAAKALGATTVDVTRGSQVFAQQGFDLQQSSQLAELSIKLANASEQDSATTSDQITALMNAYNLSGSMNELEKALDSWALVANISAADVEELAKASQKAASSASATGVSLDQMNAQIATIESVTRDAPEQIGNGLKTLYARLSDISLGETLEDGVDLGKVTSELQKVGVQVLDQAGQMRNVGDILEDLMGVWSDLDETSQKGAAEAIAGKYQLNRFYALMNNQDMYQEYKKGSIDASGTLNQMNEEHLDSMAGRMAKLQATLEGLFNSVFNPDNFYPAIDALTNFIDLIKKLVDSLGGGQAVLTGVVALFGRLFSNNMAQMINDANINRKIEQARKENALNVPDTLRQLGFTDPTTFQGQASKDTVDFIMKGQEALPNMSEQQAEQYNRILLDITNNSNMVTQETEKMEKAIRAAGIVGAAAQDTALGQNIQGLAEMLSQFSQGEILKQYAQNFKEGKSAAIEFKESLLTVISMQKDFESSTLTMDQKADKLKNVFNGASNALQDFREAGVLQTEKFNQMAEQLENLENQMINFEATADQNESELKELTLEVVKFIEAIQGLESGKITKDSLLKTLNTGPSNLIQGEALGQRYESEAKAFNEGVDDQKRIKSIIDTTSAIGQLAFAWQGFQSLGSIWSNKDISDGEKLLQTLMNLSMVIPNIITSWQQLGKTFNFQMPLEAFNIFKQKQDELVNASAKVIMANQGMKSAEEKLIEARANATKHITNYTNALQNEDITGRKLGGYKGMAIRRQNELNKAWEEGIAASQAQAAAEEAEATATSNLANAKKALTQSLVLVGVTVAIMAAATAWSAYQEKVRKAMEAEKEAMETSSSHAQEVSNSVQEWEKLYQKYKETGEVSQELINSSNNLVDTLDILGGKAFVASGNFETLANSIKKTETEAAKKAIEDADKLLQGEYGRSLNNNLPWNGSVQRDLDLAHTHAMMSAGFKEGEDRTGVANMPEEYQALLEVAKEGDSVAESIGKAHKTVNNLNKELERLNSLEENDRPYNWEDRKKYIENAIQAYQEFLNLEDVQAAESAYGIKSENALKLEDFQQKIKDAGTDAQKLINVFATDVNTKDYFATLTSEADKFRYMLKNINDEAQKAVISKELFNYNSENAVTKEQRQEFFDKNYLPFKNASPLQQTEYTNDLFNQLAEDIQNADISEEAKNAIRENIDWSKPIDEIIATTLESLEKQVETEANANPLRDLKPTDKDVKEEDYQSLGETFMDNKENLSKEGTPFEDYSSELTNNAEALDEVVEGILRYDDAIQSIGKSFEDWRNALINTNEFSQEHITAIKELKDTYADFLDLSEDMNVSEEFAADAENLDLMKDAAEGVDGAYEELAKRASEDILIHMEVDNPDVAIDTVNQIFDELNSENFQQIKIGDLIDLDDGGAFDSLHDRINDLAIATGWTADQMSAYLSNIGLNISPDMFEPISSGLDSLQFNAAATGDTLEENLSGSVDTTVESATDTAEDQLNYTELIPVPGLTIPIKSTYQMGVGDKIETKETVANVTGTNFIASTHTVPQTKQQTGHGLKMQYNKGKGGQGGVQLKQGATGTKGSRGAAGRSKPAMASRPSYSGGKGGGSCFVANTLVTMHGFYKKIQEITKGDIVLSYNETTKINEYSQVIQTMIHSTTEEIYTLSIKDEQLRVTGIHRFFIKRNNSIDWIEASNLKVGDLVFLADGTWSKILNISVNIETRYVYNFEVSNNHNYYVGTNRILAHNKGGGGGGGGGSGKTYEPKTKEPIEEEIDLYEKVNTQLDDVEETLKGIQQETDRLIGARGRANMNKQIKLLQKEIDLQREKLKIQEKERNDLGRQLSSNFGVTFDSEGFINNYAATLKRLEKAHNDLVNQYNATGTEEGQEALEKQIEKAKENIDKFKDLYKRYDELQGKEIKDTINQIEELDDSIEDLRIDAYKAAQEAIDDLKEIRDNGAELLGLFTDYKSDSPFRATIVDAEKLKNIFGGTKKDAMQYYDTLIRKNQELAKTAKTTEDRLAAESAVAFFQGQKLAANNNPLGAGALGLASQDLQRLQYWVNNPTAGDNPFGKNTAALYEAYEDAYNRMRELAMESEEAWEQLEEDIIDGYDDIAEREEEQIDRYDRLSERLENIADMRALVYGEEEFGNIARIYDQIGRSTLQQAKDQKMIYEQWIARYQAIEDKTSDIAKEVRTHMEEAEDRLIEIQKEVAEAWQEAFENTLKEITAQTNKNLFGARNLDDTQSDWERDREYSEKYYDNVQKAARVDQLRAKYLALLDDAQGSSLDIQRRIRDAMNEQVKYLESQKNLSEYNVKYANAQLEILQKQIALEDARNNKNQMRLRRDTQGNYRYVYSANQDDIRDKEQDLLQSQMDAYDMSKQNRLDTTQEAFNLYRTTMEQLEALNQRIRQGDEEAVKAKEQLLEDFERDMKAYSEEIGDSWNGMVESLKWMAETGTDTVKDTVEAALTAIEEKNDEALTNMGVKGNETIVNAISDVESLLDAVTNANNDMTTQAETYRKLINDEVAPLVKQGYNDIDGAIQNASESTKNLAAATRELNEALTGDNAQLVKATQQLENYRKQLDNVKNSSAITAQQLRKAQQELDQSKAQNLNYKTILDDIAAGRRDKNGNLPTPKSSGGGSGDRSIREGRKVRILTSYAVSSDSGYISNPLYGPGSIMYIQNVPGWGVGPINGKVHVGTETRFGWDTQVGWIRPEDLEFLNTGGYTGDWNSSEGKLAMLHQKELVLNASDTENILQAVDMVRNMAEMLKTFSGMSVKGTGFNKLGGDTIEQRVEITAEFPNVQDSKEIENALLNIADSAYQYSYRTR